VSPIVPTSGDLKQSTTPVVADVHVSPFLIKGTSGEVESKKQDLNVIVLILDDVGIEKFQGYVGITGNPNQVCRIPNIKNTVINNGIQFNYFWSATVCGVFRACFETGLYSVHSGFMANITEDPSVIDGNFYLGCDPSDRSNHAKQWIQCLPSAVRNGRPNSVYKVGKFGKSHLQPITGYDGFPTQGEGWDEFHGHSGNLAAHYTSWDKIDSVRGGATTRTTKTNVQITNDQLADIQTWLTGVGTRPFVLVWASNEGHETTSYECPDPARVSTTSKNEWIAAFGGSYPTIGQNVGPTGTQDPVEQAKRKMMQKHQIEALDSAFGELVTFLQAHGQFDNTVFIVLSDNGTEASVVEAPFDNSHYKRTVYAGALRCPLWISGPVVGQYPRQSTEIINSVDLYQTILDICDVYPQGANADLLPPSVVTQHSRDSISFLPHIKDPSVLHTRSVNFSLRGGPYNGYGYDPSRKLYIPNNANSVWAVANKDYYFIRFGGSSITEKMWLAPDYLQEDKDNVLATDPNNPAVIAGRAALSAALNVITNT
jgi:arylsulfatase A-like enzyme